MSYYYPQVAVVLKVLFEDFKEKDADTQDLKGEYTLHILARRVTVNINDYKQADTFSCEIDYKQFPFDPRCIRSCGVTIHMEDMKGLYDSSGIPKIIQPAKSNITFIGFADEETISFDDEHRVVRMEGRDYTALLLDLKFPSAKLDLSRPFVSLVEGFLKANLATAAIEVDNRLGALLPSISSFAPGFTPGATVKNPKSNETLWDLLQELADRAAVIMYIELDKLVITKPRVLYGRDLAKQLIYGSNLKTLEFKRKLGRKKNFNIKTTSFNAEKKIVESAAIPKEATVAWSEDVGVDASENTISVTSADGNPGDEKVAPYMTFSFPNMTKAQLIECGQKIYEEVGRQQLEGSLTSKEMLIPEHAPIRIPESGARDEYREFDVLKLRVGTPVEVHIAQRDLEGIAELASEAQKAKFLEMRGYTKPVAQALSKTLNKFHPKFYTKGVQFTIEEDSGFSFKLDFINFIELDNAKIGANG